MWAVFDWWTIKLTWKIIVRRGNKWYREIMKLVLLGELKYWNAWRLTAYGLLNMVFPFCSLMIHEVKHLLCSGWSLTNPHCVLQELNCVIAPCVVTLSPCLQVYLMTRANWAIPCPWWRTCQWWLCLACFWFHWKFWIQQWCGVVTCCPRPLLWSWFKASPCSHVPNPD